MPTINQITSFLESFAPLRLAEDWDNVGLLVGRRKSEVRRIMTCLTVTPDSATEAIERQADLIVTHHPMPFKPLKKITTDNVPGQMLLDLIQAGIAIYSPHTAFDSAAAGINQQLANSMGLIDIEPLVPSVDDPDGLGSGRYGRLDQPVPLSTVANSLKDFLAITHARIVGTKDSPIQKVAIACGSAGSFLSTANRHACDLFVTGETTFHTCLEAEATGINLLLVGHYASERFACEQLSRQLANQFADTTVWASEREHDPLSMV